MFVDQSQTCPAIQVAALSPGIGLIADTVFVLGFPTLAKLTGVSRPLENVQTRLPMAISLGILPFADPTKLLAIFSESKPTHRFLAGKPYHPLCDRPNARLLEIFRG